MPILLTALVCACSRKPSAAAADAKPNTSHDSKPRESGAALPNNGSVKPAQSLNINGTEDDARQAKPLNREVLGVWSGREPNGSDLTITFLPNGRGGLRIQRFDDADVHWTTRGENIIGDYIALFSGKGTFTAKISNSKLSAEFSLSDGSKEPVLFSRAPIPVDIQTLCDQKVEAYFPHRDKSYYMTLERTIGHRPVYIEFRGDLIPSELTLLLVPDEISTADRQNGVSERYKANSHARVAMRESSEERPLSSVKWEDSPMSLDIVIERHTENGPLHLDRIDPDPTGSRGEKQGWVDGSLSPVRLDPFVEVHQALRRSVRGKRAECCGKPPEAFHRLRTWARRQLERGLILLESFEDPEQLFLIQCRLRE